MRGGADPTADGPKRGGADPTADGPKRGGADPTADGPKRGGADPTADGPMRGGAGPTADGPMRGGADPTADGPIGACTDTRDITGVPGAYKWRSKCVSFRIAYQPPPPPHLPLERLVWLPRREQGGWCTASDLQVQGRPYHSGGCVCVWGGGGGVIQKRAWKVLPNNLYL